MPRISLWRGNKSHDYKFFDRRISEMFTTGATDMYLHKYEGPIQQIATGDTTLPTYETQSPTNIQDILFLENRDRKYSPDIYILRGAYQISDLDFDMSQFGLFLTGDTLFVTFHLNDMVESIGRKIMSGDVLEMPHRKDLYALDDTLPTALKRYYVVQDTNFSAEGYSPTWFPHLWRAKCVPLVDSQEYAGILSQLATTDSGISGVGGPTSASTLGDVLSTYNQTLSINEAIIQQAGIEVPESGYDTTKMFISPTNPDGSLADPFGYNTAGALPIDTNGNPITNAPHSPRYKLSNGYLTDDGIPPNGLPVATGIAFPNAPATGDYALRLDFLPNRLFRYDGARWVKQEDALRTPMNWADSTKTQLGTFVNNTNTVVAGDGTTVASRQSLSNVLKPKADF